MKWLLLFLSLHLANGSSATTKSAILGQLYPFSRLFIEVVDWTAQEPFPEAMLTLHNYDIIGRFERLRIEVVDKLPTKGERLEKLMLKNGEIAVLVADNYYQLCVLNKTAIAEALNFVLEQILGSSPSPFGYIEACTSMEFAPLAMDLLTERRVKAKGMFTCFAGEERLLALINATQPSAVYITVEELVGDNEENRLSDAFFGDPGVQNIQGFHFFDKSSIVDITDETLLQLKAKRFVVEDAPKLTLAGVRRFFQAALDGIEDRTLTFAPSFKFDESVFLEGLNVTKVLPQNGETSRWEGNGGPPKFIRYRDNAQQQSVTKPPILVQYLNSTRSITLTVVNEKIDCAGWPSRSGGCLSFSNNAQSV